MCGRPSSGGGSCRGSGTAATGVSGCRSLSPRFELLFELAAALLVILAIGRPPLALDPPHRVDAAVVGSDRIDARGHRSSKPPTAAGQRSSAPSGAR